MSHMAEENREKERDHKKLGRELELFAFSDTVGKGLPLFLPHGATIRRELERFIVDEELKRGYLHVYTPDIARLELYKKSGHYPYYKDSMYAPIEIEDEEFMLRPMTCPHHFELYLSRPRSYRELPMRIAEVAKLYRFEQSGELMGLQRVRSFCLADAHIVCASEEQAMEEVEGALELIEFVADTFGLVYGKEYRYRLSLGDSADTTKFYKNDKAWEKGEDLLRKLMKERGKKFEEAKGEAAFYGPKIDIQMKNVNGKEDTAFTVQYDFCMRDKFNLAYVGEDGKDHRAFVVHRSSIGALERSMAFLIEHYGGAFPLWLSPVQTRVLPIGEAHFPYAKGIADALKSEGLRVELDESAETLGKKIRNAKMQKIPYLLVIGDKEASAKTLSVEHRDSGSLGTMSVEDFLARAKDEIRSRK